ncbi:MAG: hypothetical protein MUF71_22115 [Candidatus Kapabacteria bacterium]|nr:hypothetical protein [Candidatus Kapabacteria bacterium]
MKLRIREFILQVASLLGLRCVTTFASKFGASRLAPTELVASGDCRSLGLRLTSCGIYGLCTIISLSTAFSDSAGAESSAGRRTDACVE